MLLPHRDKRRCTAALGTRTRTFRNIYINSHESGFEIPSTWNTQYQCSKDTAYLTTTVCTVEVVWSIRSSVFQSRTEWVTGIYTGPIILSAPNIMVKYRVSDPPLLRSVSPLWGVPISSRTNSWMSLVGSPPSTSPLPQTAPSVNLPTQTIITPPLDPSQLSQTAKLATAITIRTVFILSLTSVIVFFRPRSRRRSKNHSVETE
jgi:hypothetical protein